VRNPTRRKSRSMSDQNESKRAPSLGPDIMAAVGRQLRVIYADIVAEGVPAHFAEILRRLEEPSHEGSKNAPTPPTT
jgi:Anti-sigma factor NepR